MTQTKFQDFVGATIDFGDTLLIRDISDIALNAAGQIKQVLWDDVLAQILALARDGRLTVLNGTGSTIAKGAPVAFGGFSGVSGTISVILADADGSGTMPVIGVAGADIAASGIGDIVFDGSVVGTATAPYNTTAWSEGTQLYISATAGVYTTTPPTTTFIQAIAMVARSHATLGQLLVRVRAPGTPISALAALSAVAGTEQMATDGDKRVTTDQINSRARSIQPYISDATSARTLALTDAGQHIGMTTTATVTIPTNAAVALPVGSVIYVSADSGAGVVTIAGANTVIVNGVTANGSSTGRCTINTNWRGVVALLKIATDTWVVRGDCSAVV